MAVGEAIPVYIPEEIVTDIITRLRDGRSIVRFRCVSKLCCRLLSDPNFIYQSLWSDHDDDKEEQIAKQSPQPQVMIQRRRSFWGPYKLAYSLLSYDCDDTALSLRPMFDTTTAAVTAAKDGGRVINLQYLDLPVVPGADRPPPRSCDNLRFTIVGCCDGIFCISDRVRPHAGDLILWNPSTSETKVLPVSPEADLFCSRVGPGDFRVLSEQIGFGFDSKTRDYKVVRTMLFLYSAKTVTEVYSLRNDSWKKHDFVSDMEDERYYEPNYAVAQSHKCRSTETVYWRYSNGMKYKGIASFDMRTEVFDSHELPTHLRRSMKGLTDELQLIATPKESTMAAIFGDSHGVYHIWGLLKFQTPKSWIKLFSISRFLVSDVDSALGWLSSKDGCNRSLFLKKGGELLAYNPKTEEIVDLGIQAITEPVSDRERQLLVAIRMYLPSQIPITSLDEIA